MIHAAQQESMHTPIPHFPGGVPVSPLLELNPNKFVEFLISANASSSQLLTLCNISETWVAYKIKTTSPKSYNVRPSMGIIPPSQDQAIRLTLSALPPDVFQDLLSTEDASNGCSVHTNNRFLVLSYPLVGEPSGPLAPDFWNSKDKNLLRDQRLHVVLKKKESSLDGPSQDADVSKKAILNGQPTYSTRGPVNTFNATTHGKSTVSGQGASTKPGMQSISFSERSIGSREVDPGKKYEEVVHYCLALEKKLVMLQSENRNLMRQLENGTRSNLVCDLVSKMYSRPFLILLIPALICVLFKILQLW